MRPGETERAVRKRLDPYALRACALNHRLEPYELGRALFHLDQRRGFKSNRKAVGEDENEAKKTRAEIGELRRRIDESGARTLGEFLARRRKNGEPVRARPGLNLYPDRAMYETEFKAIRAKQERHHDLSGKQWNRLHDIIFFQRPLKPVEPGWCQFEHGERRAPKALPVVQEFRMLQEVNNIRIRVGSDPERPLDEAEARARHGAAAVGQENHTTRRQGQQARSIPPEILGCRPERSSTWHAEAARPSRATRRRSV